MPRKKQYVCEARAKGQSLLIGEGDKGYVELMVENHNGKVIASVEIHPLDVPEVVSTILSIAGWDTYGRDVAVELRKRPKDAKET